MRLKLTMNGDNSNVTNDKQMHMYVSTCCIIVFLEKLVSKLF